MQKLASLCLSLLTVVLFSCGNKLELTDVPADSLSKIQDQINDLISDTTGSAYPITGAPSQRQTWMDLLKSCYESGNFNKNLINNDLLYLGPSSNMYLGTIVDKKILKNSFNVKTELKYLIPAADFKKFAVIGESVNNCDLSKMTDINFSLDAVLSGVIAQGMTDSLGLKIGAWDSLKVLSGKWQIDYIRESDFRRYLNDNKNNPDVAFFTEQVFNKKYRIITKVVKVTGFSADAFYKGDLSAGVQAALSNPVSVKVVNNQEEEKQGSDITAKVTFSKKSSREVHISSQNSFYVFGIVRAGKQL